MKTKLNVSNISYNTIPFLDSKLKELVNSNKIDFYMYIFHKAEEGELSNHIHIIFYPTRGIDTKELDCLFTEPDPNNILPLGMSKKWKPVYKDCDLEWILYVLHDPVYCKAKSKGLKKYLYIPENIISNDERTKQDLIFQAYHETEFYHDKAITEMIIDNNLTGSDLINNGYVSIKNACAYHHYVQMLKGG